MDLHRSIPGRLTDVDAAAFRSVARWHTPALDATLPKLTHFADYSRLWFVIAAILAAAGGRKGRRAALRGVGSLGLTSLIVNLPVKRLMARKRPDISPVPKIRRGRRTPISGSFPSGHSASAFAFAVGVSQEMPKLSAPLGALAGSVAFSRVYTGAHYPSDVIVGSALGAAMSAATRRWFPMAPTDPADLTLELSRERRTGLPEGRGVLIVTNDSAGSDDDGPLAILRRELPYATVISSEEGGDITSLLEEKGSGAEVIGVAGGDGTVGAAAAYCLAKGKPLLPIPTGTLNHFARQMGIERVEDAIEAVKVGTTATVDVGLIAEQPFLNTASFGAYSEFVDARKRLERRFGKWTAMLVGLIKSLRTASPIEVMIDGEPKKLWMVFIGNCAYEPSGFAPSWRKKMDDGQLDVRMVTASTPLARSRLIMSLVGGRLARCVSYEERLVTQLKVVSPEHQMRLARDGEVFDGPGEFVIEKMAGALQVYAPERS